MTRASPKRQRALSCTPREQAMIRRQGPGRPARGQSRHVLDLGRADDPERHPLVLSETEQEELRAAMAEMTAFLRARRRGFRPAVD